MKVMTGKATGEMVDGRSRARIATDRKIDRAVMQIVSQEGPSAVTISRVSEVSGVARTTLYRRYDASADILADVAGRIAPLDAVESSLDLEGFEQLLAQLQAVFQSEGILPLVSHIISADESFKQEWRSRFIGPRLGGLRGFLDRGVAQGVLDPHVDRELIVEFIVGSAIAEGALHGRPGDDWAARVARALWPMLVGRVC